MLFHHDDRPYDVATKAAGDRGRDGLEKEIERGKNMAANVIQRLDREVPADYLCPVPKLRFETGENGVLAAVIRETEKAKTFNDWSLGQMAEWLGVPGAFARGFGQRGGWQAEALADLFNRCASHGTEKLLVRAIGDRVRGVLSNGYGRDDSRPNIEAFILGARASGAIPVDARISDTRVSIKLLVPELFEPVPGEVVAFGAEYLSSDFGNGAKTIATFIDRPWCTNYARLRNELRKVHIGKRMESDADLSERTMKLDAAATRSAVQDVTAATLSPEKIKGWLEAIREANEAKVDAREIKAFLQKTLATKAEVKKAEETFASAEVELLPPGQTKWRLSNVLSLLAQEAPTDDQRLDYQRAAGRLIDREAA